MVLKKLLTVISITLTTLIIGFCLNVNAAGHTHGDSCYTTTEGHKHNGNTSDGGSCYATPVYHTHSGSTSAGGGCYTTPVYHTHSGSTSAGGSCYATPVYHTHSGSTSAGGGCYTTPEYCGGSITAKTVVGGSYTVGPGAKEYATGACPFCSTTHGYCIQCGIGYSCGGFRCNGHQTTTTTYSCSKCGTTYSGTGTCNKLVSYGLSCGKTTFTVESYKLSCSKTGTTIESYKLSCSKTVTTIESYKLSCDKEECAATRTLTCTIPESSGESPKPSETPKPSESPKQSETPTATETPKPTKTPKPTVTPEPTETPKPTATPKPSKEPEEIKVELDPSQLDFELEYKFVEEGVYVEIIPSNVLLLADIPYCWDRETWEKKSQFIYSETGTFYISVKNANHEIKTKVLTIDLTAKTVTIEDEDVALAAAASRNKSNIIPVAVATGGIAVGGFFIFALWWFWGLRATIWALNGTQYRKVGTAIIKKKKKVYSLKIPKSTKKATSNQFIITFSKHFLKRHEGEAISIYSVSSKQTNVIKQQIEFVEG